MKFRILCVCVMLAVLGCGADFDDPNDNNGFFNNGQNNQNNNQNNNNGGTDDYCEIFGWYGDGSCDEICLNPDPDCDGDNCTDQYPSNYNFVSTDPNECSLLDFLCVEGSSYFSNDCGCGCVDDAQPFCPDPDDPNVEYIGGSDEDPEICELIDFACFEGAEAFYIPECGCGCIYNDVCEQRYNDPSRDYLSTDPFECEAIRFVCDEASQPFFDECGCGCVSDFCPNPNDPNVIYFSTDPVECSQEIGGDGEIVPNCPPNSEYFNNPECGCGCVIDDRPFCEYNNPDIVWVGTSPGECAFDGAGGDGAFLCPDDMVWFENECGCGCAGYCPDPTDPDVNYVGHSPQECALIDFDCGPNQDYFNSACGCGCINDCPDPNDPDVIYISQDPAECNVLGAFACPNGFDGFYDSCGCGCKRTSGCSDDADCLNGYCAITQNGGQCIFPECGDGSQILCDALPPVCPPGMTPYIENGCYGPCVDARTCLLIVPG